MDKRSFDAIVIGSGMGGLTTAGLLAQAAKMRVLMLERHFKLGGFTHSFRRKQFEWDTGIHYVGQMQSGTLTRRVMDYVTGGSVAWHPMNDVVERILFPDTSFEIPRGSRNFQAKLLERFPDERVAIDQYFRDVRKAQVWMNRWFIAKTLPRFAADFWLCFGKMRAMQITAERLRGVKSDELRAILTAQWPDYGTPPEQSAFAVHATVAADYFDGGFFPVGGGKRIAESVKAIVTQRGGECRTGHEVVRILTEQNRVTGVRVRHKGDEFEVRAPLVISNVGARNTFTKLLDDNVVTAERNQLDQIAHGVSAVVLFLGLNSDPRDHGFDDANYWIYGSLDVGRAGNSTEKEDFPLNAAFVSFGSIRDPQKKSHSAQIITFCSPESWKAFEDSQWMRRGGDYEARKERIAEALLDFAERSMPGLRNLVEYQELATPLTVKSFTDHPGGQVYGQPCTPDRLDSKQWRIETSVKNLYLTGSDVGLPGINGAMMGGVMAAARALGPFGLMRIMTHVHWPSSRK